MAIILPVAHRSGAYSGYWRITDVQIQLAARRGEVTLSGYVSAAARQEGRPPLDSRLFVVDGATFDQYLSVAALQASTDVVANAYALVTRSIPDASSGAETNPFYDAPGD